MKDRLSDLWHFQMLIPDESIYTYWEKSDRGRKKTKLLFEKNTKPTKNFHPSIVEKNNNKILL